MTILLAGLAVALVLGGLAGAVYPVLPGPPLVFFGLWLGAWLAGYDQVSGMTVLVLAGIALLAMLLDLVASAFGAKRVGASGWAVGGALLGAVVGIFFGLPGLLMGPFVGAVGGELLARQGLRRAANVGLATWIGMLMGAIAKLVLSLLMIGVFVLAWIL